MKREDIILTAIDYATRISSNISDISNNTLKIADMIESYLNDTSNTPVYDTNALNELIEMAIRKKQMVDTYATEEDIAYNSDQCYGECDECECSDDEYEIPVKCDSTYSNAILNLGEMYDRLNYIHQLLAIRDTDDKPYFNVDFLVKKYLGLSESEIAENKNVAVDNDICIAKNTTNYNYVYNTPDLTPHFTNEEELEIRMKALEMAFTNLNLSEQPKGYVFQLADEIYEYLTK